MHNTANGTNAAHTVRDAARQYLARGWCPVPIPHGQKRPALKRWQQLDRATLNLENLFPSNWLNVGVLLGEPSGGFVDLDLDCVEARTAAAALAPETECVWGRASAPNSHRGYVVSEPPAKATDGWNDPLLSGKGARLLELRSTGGQTVVPPSLLPGDEATGKVQEPCVWDSAGEPAKVDLADLRAAIDRVAAAALLGRYWPTGNRHDCALALSGGLLRAGWAREQVSAFVRTVCAVAGDEEVTDRVRAAEDTAERMRKGDNATGWPRLASLLGEHGTTIVRAAAQWCGNKSLDLFTTPQTRDQLAPPKPPAPVAPVPEYQPFPVEALPNGLREYVTELAASVGADPAFAALPALTVVGAAAGASVTVSPKRGFAECPALWICTIGDSGTGKSPALKPTASAAFAINGQLKKAYQREMGAFAKAMEEWTAKEEGKRGKKPAKPVRAYFAVIDTTIERLAEMLGDSPRGIAVIRDELSAWFGSFARYKGKAGGSDLPNWLSMYDAGPLSYHRRTGEPRDVEVDRAYVAVCGGTQPDVLKAILSDESFIHSGLAARLMFAMPPKRCPRWADAVLSVETETRFRKLLDRLRAIEFAKGEDPAQLTLTDAAKARFVRLNNEFAERAESLDGGAMAAALPKAIRFALRLALVWHLAAEADAGCDPLASPVGDEAMAAGETLARWLIAEAERVYAVVAESPERRGVRKLVELIRRKGGRIRPRDLQRSNSSSYPKAADARLALEQLASAGFGEWQDDPPNENGGPPSESFVLCEPDTRHPTEPDTAADGGGSGAPDAST